MPVMNMRTTGGPTKARPMLSKPSRINRLRDRTIAPLEPGAEVLHEATGASAVIMGLSGPVLQGSHPLTLVYQKPRASQFIPANTFPGNSQFSMQSRCPIAVDEPCQPCYI